MSCDNPDCYTCGGTQEPACGGCEGDVCAAAHEPRAESDLDELERMRSAAYPGRWYYEDHSDDVWELYAENVHMGMVVHPLKILKAAKQGGPYANWWPRKEEAEWMCAAVNAAPALIKAARERDLMLTSREVKPPHIVRQSREIDTLRARVAGLEARLEKVRKLPERWRNDSYDLCDDDYGSGCCAQLGDCADQLSAALTSPEAAALKEEREK